MKAAEDFKEELMKLEHSLDLNFRQVRNVYPLIDFTKDFGIEVDIRVNFAEFKDQMWDLDKWGELPLVDVCNYQTGENFEARVVRIDSRGLLVVDMVDYDTQIVGFNDLSEIRDRLHLYGEILHLIK